MHALRYFKNLESGKEKRCQNWELCTKLAVCFQLHSAAPAQASLSLSRSSIISIGREVILQEVGKRDSVHTWTVPVHLRGKTQEHERRNFLKLYIMKRLVFWKREQYRNLPQQNTLLYTTSVSFSVLVIMIRSCLAKKDNKGVYIEHWMFSFFTAELFLAYFPSVSTGAHSPCSMMSLWAHCGPQLRNILAQCSLAAHGGLQ